MAGKNIHPKEIARFAAEGVAIALKAREPEWRGPVHIICGIPPEIFQVTLQGNPEGTVSVSVGERQASQ